MQVLLPTELTCRSYGPIQPSPAARHKRKKRCLRYAMSDAHFSRNALQRQMRKRRRSLRHTHLQSQPHRQPQRQSRKNKPAIGPSQQGPQAESGVGSKKQRLRPETMSACYAVVEPFVQQHVTRPARGKALSLRALGTRTHTVRLGNSCVVVNPHHQIRGIRPET